MSTSKKPHTVPKEIQFLTLDDWHIVFSQLNEEQQSRLKNLIEIRLNDKAKNRKKRNLDKNESSLEGPPKKKLKLNQELECKSTTIDEICVRLCEDAIKDGIKKFVVGGLILKENKQVLLLQRAKNEFMPNIYEIPSGTKDPEDKTLIDCLAREVNEETGLVLDEVVQFVNAFDYKSSSGKPTRQFNFIITTKSTDAIKISDEHQAFAWIEKEELHNEDTDEDLFNDIVSKITKEVRTVIRKGFKILMTN